MPFKNRGEYLKYQKNYRIHHKEEHKKWCKDNYNLHKTERLNYAKDYRNKNINKVLENGQNWRDKNKIKKIELIGNKCIICGSKNYVDYHEIHGKKHTPSLLYYIKHFKDFIPLCRDCHKSLHGLMRLNDEELNKILVYLKIFKIEAESKESQEKKK